MSVEKYRDNTEVNELVKQQQKDYQTSLMGKLPHFYVNIPEDVTAQRFLDIQNKITKSKQYIK